MSVLDHPTRTRILNLLRAIDELPVDPQPLLGGDDVHIDADVAAAFAHRTDRSRGDQPRCTDRRPAPTLTPAQIAAIQDGAA